MVLTADKKDLEEKLKSQTGAITTTPKQQREGRFPQVTDNDRDIDMVKLCKNPVTIGFRTIADKTFKVSQSELDHPKTQKKIEFKLIKRA